jgi:hypothetical protein
LKKLKYKLTKIKIIAEPKLNTFKLESASPFKCEIKTGKPKLPDISLPMNWFR